MNPCKYPGGLFMSWVIWSVLFFLCMFCVYTCGHTLPFPGHVPLKEKIFQDLKLMLIFRLTILN